MATTHINGDKAEYLGTSEVIHGGTFFHVRMVEGRFIGQTKVTQRGPDGSDPHLDFRRNQHATMQADFAKL